MATDEPVIATDRITINGALAFVAGDVVPATTAKALGIAGKAGQKGPISARADESGIVKAAATADVVAGRADLSDAGDGASTG